MVRDLLRAVRFALTVTLLAPSLALAAGVQALFDLESPVTSPFPSDWFTVADASHNTGRRVNLPAPDCGVRPSDCEDVEVINTLDGFNLQPRLSIPFDGPIDVGTVTSDAVFLIRLGGMLDRDDHGGTVGINQVVWDPFTNTLHVESDELLDQHTRYALIVTRRVRDEFGAPIEPTEAFQRFRQTVRGPYKQALLDAMEAAMHIGVREAEIATASVFTTQSVTAVLEKIRDQIKAATPAPADFLLAPGNTRAVFALSEVSGITFNRQTSVNGPLSTVPVTDFPLLRIIPGAVSRIAFGKYLSPDYEVHPGDFIPPVGTRNGTPIAQGVNEIHFNVVLPSGNPPLGGWPVAIFGHGRGANKTLGFTVAASMAARGIATISINVPGHGFGPLSTLTVSRPAGAVTIPAGGRGFDQNGDGVITATEGFEAALPRTIIAARDGTRQAVADLIQLVRVIEVGIDVDGDGHPDLDPSRIYYFGNSLGGNMGPMFLALEPHVRAGVPVVAGGSPIELLRLAIFPSNPSRPLVGASLASRTPSLINPPGVTALGGIAVGPPHFNENIPLRDGIPLAVRLADGTSYEIKSPVINAVQGAMEIQQMFENAEWVAQSGDPVPYAPHLRLQPLAGVSAKPLIFLMAKGDQSAPNPTNTAVLRAGHLADGTIFYRHDLAFAERPTLLKNPHRFLVDVAGFGDISLGAQELVATFFASDGQEVIHPEPARFFEVPIVPPPPEDLNFIP
jgi:hypothetical protein